MNVPGLANPNLGFGQATTRDDGRFDLIVNGGATYSLRFSKANYFSADRFVTVGWQQTAAVDDVLLVAPDAKTTVVNAPSPYFERVVGTLTHADTADSKDRTAVLMIPKNTQFKVGGSNLSTVTMRLTEYTAGADGPKRMPASLTGSPAYTYAIEVSADEANGQSVEFKDAAGNPQPVALYVDEFLGLPVGAAVPTGYYDRDKQAWIPSVSGVVVQVTVSGGVATVNSNGVPLTISADELVALVAQYPTASALNLWRVPITHMTPYDCNYPVAPPPCDGSGACPGPTGGLTPPAGLGGCGGGCCGASAGSAAGDNLKPGSIIGCDSQTLGEQFKVAGTPYTLNYNSRRTGGYAAKRELKIDLATDAQRLAAKVITVDVAIAGQTHHREFTPAPNLSWTFLWDGLDGAGRPVVGTATATVTIRSYYVSKYFLVSVFGELPAPGLTSVASQRSYVSYERTLQAGLTGQLPSGGWSLGDWTLDQHHFLDVPSNTLYLGTGSTKSSVLALPTIERVVGDGGAALQMAADGASATTPSTGLYSAENSAVAVAPNGELFVADRYRNIVRGIDSAGKIWTVAGSGTTSCIANGPPNFANSATDARLSNLERPSSLAIGADGSIYIASADVT